MASRAFITRFGRPARLLAAIAEPPFRNSLCLPSPCSPFSPIPHPLPCPRYFSWWSPSPSSPPSPPEAAHTETPFLNHPPDDDNDSPWTNRAPDDDDLTAISDPPPADTFASSVQDVCDGLVDAGTTTIATSWTSPTDLVITFLDTLHSVTGFPWWVTIASSAVLLRMFLFPMTIMQMQRVARLVPFIKKVQARMLAKGMRTENFKQEYLRFKKEHRDLGYPSFLWMLCPGFLVQIPAVVMMMYSLRRMALEQHSDLIVGGTLWFKDLTVSAQAPMGAVLPILVSLVYFANVQVAFQGSAARMASPESKGLVAVWFKVWKKLLQLGTILSFIILYQLPQAVHVFSVAHSIMTLCQGLLLHHPKFLAIFMHPNLLRHDHGTLVMSSTYDGLLKDAGRCFTSGKSKEAIQLLEKAIKEQPEKEEAYALLGWVYTGKKDWVKSDIYYKLAISKAYSQGKNDDSMIAAYAGSGNALLEQGKTMEAIEMLRAVRQFKVPINPNARDGYITALLKLSSALRLAGLRDEDREVTKEAFAMIVPYLQHGRTQSADG